MILYQLIYFLQSRQNPKKFEVVTNRLEIKLFCHNLLP